MLKEEVIERIKETVFDEYKKAIMKRAIEELDAEKYAEKMAYAELYGFKIEGNASYPVEALEQQGWSINELKIEAELNYYWLLVFDIVAPNGKKAKIYASLITKGKDNMTKDEYQRFINTKQKYLNEIMPEIMQKLKKRIEELEKELEECKKKEEGEEEEDPY